MSAAFEEVGLADVFGISTDIPEYTYVDRQMLDERFEHYLASQKHIVVHGASKQGKSCLRKKNISSDNCIIVQCTPSMENENDIWRTALEIMEKRRLSQTTKTQTSEQEFHGNLGANMSLPFVGDIGGEVRKTGTEGHYCPKKLLIER